MVSDGWMGMEGMREWIKEGEERGEEW